MSERSPSDKRKKFVLTLLRWTVAVVGVAWVLSNLSLRDTVTIEEKDTHLPITRPLASSDAGATTGTYDVVSNPNPWWTYALLFLRKPEEVIPVPRELLLSRPDRKTVDFKTGGKAKLLAIKPAPGAEKLAAELLVEDPATKLGRWVKPTEIKGPAPLVYPPVEMGLVRMVRQSNPVYLWLAIFIFPVTFAIVAFRWHELLKALDIHIGKWRAFQLTMVGAFYNTFMPGSTGGDVLKAYYAAKHAPTKRTRAVMSVIIDRVVGLMTLIVMGGTIAAFQWTIPECRKVAIGAAAVVLMAVAGCVAYYTPLRRYLLIDYVIKRLPMQAKVAKALEVLDIYGRRWPLVVTALLITFPVHATVVVSASLAGNAFNLPLSWGYYWVVVPVIVLAGSIPISPQGAGVMEFFAVVLTATRGATVGQAIALTMSVRLVQILWNLTGAIFVFRGGFHAPTDNERQELDVDAGPLPEPEPTTNV